MSSSKISEEFKRKCREMKKHEVANIRKGKEIKRVLNNCKKSEYKYGFEKLNLFDLVKIVKNENKKVHVNDFLDLFPETNFTDKIKVTRSHVFEALWIIIFVLRLDDLFPNTGATRKFYNRVEEGKVILPLIGTNNHGIKKFFNDSNVNESNKSGIVDIYFEDVLKTAPEGEAGYACEKKCQVDKSSSLTTTYYYSCKYFQDDKKKGIGSLDIEKIFTEVIKLNKKEQSPYKIGVLVNDIDVILKKQARSQKAAASLLKSDVSYGIGKLNIYYKRLLDYLDKCDFTSENPFNETSSIPHHIQPRVHQDYFIKFTDNQIQKGKNKFIWGAVPRSGKSFMIGGLIAKRQPQCVLLILGAVSETHDQFRKDVFEKFKGSFGDYNIIDVKDKKEVTKFASLDPERKNIVIVSQQQLWQKGEGENLRDYPQLNAILKTTDKMIFFDEIHQGASSNAEAQQKILNKYVVGESERLTFPFIMVTATFIKPMLKYELLGKEKGIVLQWTYDMMQNMKTIANGDTQQLIIQEIREDRDIEIGRVKSELFKKLLDDYQKRGFTLTQLQEEYEKEPELSIICPALTETNESLPEWTYNDTNMRDIFNIEKVESGQTQGLQELLEYIKKGVYGIGNPSAVLAENNFNVLTRQHSQLWFLPTKLKGGKSEEGEGEVEPMMRYLLSEVMKNNFFRDNFCFVLMHSKNVSTKKKEYRSILPGDLSELDEPHRANLETTMEKSGNKICFSTICLPPNKGNKKGDKECLREEECNAYNKKKSLIIFTGAKLRLGISLPCVDIAIHMDPIISVDTIYQSMFRVLTPYPGKKKGYFVDLLKNRVVRFMYEYENQLNYNKSNNLPEKKLARLRNLIFSHDLNGILMKEEDTKEYLQEYTNLVKVLGLENVNTFQQKSEEFKLNKETAQTVIDSVCNDECINHLYKVFDLSKAKSLKDKISKILHKRGEGTLATKETRTTEPNEIKKKEVSIKEKREQVTIYFLNLISLFILFEDDNEKDCTEKDVKLGLNNISHIKQITHFNNSTYQDLCDYDSEKNASLKCYLRMLIEGDSGIKGDIDSIDTKVIKLLLETFNQKLHTFQEMVKMIKKNNMPELINIYCNIKNSFLMVKEKYHPENMSIQSCSDSFIQNEKILKIIRERLTVRTTEKEQHGEVFTPPLLVCEMFDTLPPSVWENKGLTWLDPANGIGNFPVIAYYKLMDGLKKAIPDDKERSKHIIKKMLFMVELNPVNVNVCKKIFKMIDPNVTPNIAKANFLTETSKWKRELGRDTFDIVMGNPPYNEGGIRSKSTEKVSRVGDKSNTIWPDFVKLSLSILNNNNSYLLFVHPASWISLKSDRADMILANQLLNLRYYNVVKAHKMFGNTSGEIPITYYLIQNKKSKKSTLIYDNAYDKFIEFNIYENNFIPTESIEMMKHIYSFTKSSGSLVDNYTRVSNSKSKNDTFSHRHPFPLINISRGNIIVQYTETNNLDNLNKKLLLPNASMGYPILDVKGILYPNTSDDHIIISNNNLQQLKQLQNYLFCSLIFYIIVITKTRQKFLDNKVFQILPNITNLTREIDITDDFLIKKLFKLDDKLLKGYFAYLKSGEGRLTPATIKMFKSFDISKHENGMTTEQISYVENLVKSKPSKTMKKKPYPKSSTKTRKSPHKSKSPSPTKSTKTLKKLKGGKKCNKTIKNLFSYFK